MTDKILNATHEGDLVIGDVHIPSAVLEDGTRVLLRKGFLTALGRPWKGKGRAELPTFIGAKNLIPFVSNELRNGLIPIPYKPIKGKNVSGFKAEVLPLVCDVYLEAREDKILTISQVPIAKQAEILVRSLSKVGIIALVDEATGYQEVRDRLALQKILKLYIAKELLPWAKRFPDEFYEEMFRLKEWQYSPPSVKRPRSVGKITNDIVYDRIAPGVLKELKKITPKADTGRYKHHLHRHLTSDVGHPKLSQHIHAVVALMKASSNWSQFKRLIERALPKMGNTLEIPFDVD